MAITEFQASMATFEAIDAGDDEKLATLIERFNSLYQVHASALTRYAAAGDLTILTKLLELPVVDQSSPIYANAVQSAFFTIVANNDDANIKPGVLELLYEKIKYNDEVKTRTLSSIFNRLIENPHHEIAMSGAKMLAGDKAVCDKAVEYVKKRLDDDAATARRQLQELSKLKKSIRPGM